MIKLIKLYEATLQWDFDKQQPIKPSDPNPWEKQKQSTGTSSTDKIPVFTWDQFTTKEKEAADKFANDWSGHPNMDLDASKWEFEDFSGEWRAYNDNLKSEIGEDYLWWDERNKVWEGGP